MKKLLLVMFFTMFPVLAHGATYYVAKTGSDSNSCANAQSPSTPKLSINAGAGCLSAGDTLIVKAGTYTEQLLNVIPSGSAGRPTIVQANGNAALGTGDRVIIKPPTISGYSAVVDIQNRQYITLDGFEVDGTGVFNAVIQLTGTTNHVTIQNCEVHNMEGRPSDDNGGAGVSTDVDTSASTIKNNLVHDIGMIGPPAGGVHGIYIHGVDHIIENNKIYNNASHGIHLYANYGTVGVQRNTVRGNHVYGNGARGILIQSGDNNIAYSNIVYSNAFGGLGYGTEGIDVRSGANNQVYNNTVYSNQGVGIQIESGATGAIIRNNITWKNGTDSIGNEGINTVADHNLLGTNPSFVNAAAQDFRLQAGSVAIDAGVVVSGLSYNGSAPDLGALESGAGRQLPAPTNLSLVRN